MAARIVLAALIGWAGADHLWAQAPSATGTGGAAAPVSTGPVAAAPSTGVAGLPATTGASAGGSAAGAAVAPPATAGTPATGSPSIAPAAAPIAHRSPIARVSAGPGTLPNTHGQVWREYDISPYTARVTTTKRPEQAIVDWVLRETGYEAWHSEPLGILSATPRALRVYHTPQVQAIVAEVVDRFVSPEAEGHGFSLRIVTVDSPNWRARVQRLLVPVQVQTPGAQAWLLEKEGAALLLAELKRRNDFREHNSPHLLVNNGQSTVITATRARNYVRNIVARPEVWPGYEQQPGVIDEGFSLEFSPLLSIDGRTIDAMLKCEIDQVEKLVPVMLDVPSQAAPRQRTKIEVPQLSHFRFHERFRWPVDQILVLGLGVVPTPVPGEAKPIVPGVPLALSASAPRADLLVFVGSRGKTPATTARAPGVSPAADPYRLRQ